MGAVEKQSPLVREVQRVVTAPLRAVGPTASAVAGSLVGATASTLAVIRVGARAEYAHTPGQFALAALGVALTTAWLGYECGTGAAKAEEAAAAALDLEEDREVLIVVADQAAAPAMRRSSSSSSRTKPDDMKALLVARSLRAGAEFFGWMVLVYVFDRTTLIPRAAKRPDSASFWRLWLLISVTACCTVRKAKVPRILAREQTEEWKGWMQLMFLLYHYFAQAQLYNAIRVYIAAYVWMTGYGNYLYYAKTRDFSVVRVCQTLFRLNFFALVTCVLLQNEYMLYYICPMHTLFTLFVYGALRVKTLVCADKSDDRPWHAPLAVAATMAAVAVLYDIKPVFRAAFGWWPLKPLVSFHDPVHPEFTDDLHEWEFRSGLDRYIWVGGMAAAAALPLATAFFDTVAGLATTASKTAAYGAITAALIAGPGCAWYFKVFALDKYAYNAKHPYTSFIPITIYIILRNLLPQFRSRYLHLFTYLGRVTLETYILQFHVWMKTTGLNGSPKFIADLLGPDLYWTNFALVSALYLTASIRVFYLTVTLREALVPSDPKTLLRTSAAILAATIVFYGAGVSLRTVLPAPASTQPA